VTAFEENLFFLIQEENKYNVDRFHFYAKMHYNLVVFVLYQFTNLQDCMLHRIDDFVCKN